LILNEYSATEYALITRYLQGDTKLIPGKDFSIEASNLLQIITTIDTLQPDDIIEVFWQDMNGKKHTEYYISHTLRLNRYGVIVPPDVEVWANIKEGLINRFEYLPLSDTSIMIITETELNNRWL
jgi:hypothetical protein